MGSFFGYKFLFETTKVWSFELTRLSVLMTKTKNEQISQNIIHGNSLDSLMLSSYNFFTQANTQVSKS